MGGLSSHAEDRVLIERVAGGDREAFEALYARYYRKLFGFAQRVTRSADLVEEIVSDTLLTVWRSAARFDGRSRLSTWIFGIAYRKALQSVSRRRPLDPLPEGVDAHHERVRRQRPRTDAEHRPPARQVVEEHHAIRHHERVVVRQRDDQQRQPDRRQQCHR